MFISRNRSVLVQMSDPEWTTAALETACKNYSGRAQTILLVKFVPQAFLDWLGISANDYRFNDTELDQMDRYVRLVESHNMYLGLAVTAYGENFDYALQDIMDKYGIREMIVDMPRANATKAAVTVPALAG